MALSRRRLLQSAGGAAAVVLGGGTGLTLLRRWVDPQTPLNYSFPPDATDLPSGRSATPPCREAGATDPQLEGPFYTPNTPLRTVLRDADTAGTPLVIEGRVLRTDCRPIVGAVLDVWTCDAQGLYDDDGFKLRGHQFTDTLGRFRIETIRPGDYWQFGVHRTPHVHVKVQGRDTSLLTTQLYFPDESLNAKDWLFNESLLLTIERPIGGPLHASFDFVLTPRGPA